MKAVGELEDIVLSAIAVACNVDRAAVLMSSSMLERSIDSITRAGSPSATPRTSRDPAPIPAGQPSRRAGDRTSPDSNGTRCRSSGC